MKVDPSVEGNVKRSSQMKMMQMSKKPSAASLQQLFIRFSVFQLTLGRMGEELNSASLQHG